jgi:hypothetical protein
MNDKPYWHKLLDLFERKRYFWNGLTIPFIIGSGQYIEPTEGLQTISGLIWGSTNILQNNCFHSS